MIHRGIDNIKIINSLDDMSNTNWGISAIKADKLWNKTMGENVKIALIDTGVDVKHQDISESIKLTINMHNRTTDVTDIYGHGTHVAGLLVGKRTGIAPKAELYVAKVLDDKGNGSMANILDGITFAINLNVDILCMSLGIPYELPQILEERIQSAYRKGITIVCATGNSNSSVEYPAKLKNVIGVGGIDKDLNRAKFSNYGYDMDVVAPAVDILSTHLENKYAYISGTSMASPLVAGGIALVKSYYRQKGIEISPNEMLDLFKKINNKKTEEYGYGVFDLTKLID